MVTVTSRYFWFEKEGGFYVWDRGKNEVVGEKLAAKSDAVKNVNTLNAQVDARRLL